MFAPVTVPVLEVEYTVQLSPHPLEDDGDYQLDHIDHVIWISPEVDAADRITVVAQGVAACWADRLSRACQDWMRDRHLNQLVPVLRSTERT